MIDYQDRESVQLFGIRYRATDAEANAVWLELMGTECWREHERLTLMSGRVTLNLDGISEDLLRRECAAFEATSRAVARIVRRRGLVDGDET